MDYKHKELLKALVVIAVFSMWFSWFSTGTDFPVFYNAASKIIDPAIPNAEVYNSSVINVYMPEKSPTYAFIYSMPVAYALSPLALIPYFPAKALIIFLGIISYLYAVVAVLRMNQASGRWFLYPMVMSCLWLPFIQDLRLAQVNCVILLLVSIASSLAVKGRVYLCGFLLSLAALIKLFPVAIAMTLGLKNWRILAGFVFVFLSSFLVSGSFEWFAALGNNYQADLAELLDLMPLYLFFISHFDVAWFWLYVIVIGAITAQIVYRTSYADFPLLISFAIPAVLLTMPILEYSHLTLLMFSYAYLVTSKYRHDRLVIFPVIISFVTISAAFFYSRASIHFVVSPYLSKSLMTIGLLSLWGGLAVRLSAQNKNPVDQIC